MAKLYRFATFGRSESGKTCILAAMSLSHKSHPLGYTATWVPDAPVQTSDELVLTQFRTGRKLLDAARADIERGERPKQTEAHDGIMRFRFDFTVPPRQIQTGPNGEPAGPEPSARSVAPGRKYAVELIDYSGELIHSNTTAETLAKRLRSQLNEMDALFILCEAPRPGCEGDQLYAEFELLQQAFALLSAEREKGMESIRTPVAILFNKWDRRHRDSTSPEDRALQLEAFLNEDPQPPHRTMVDFVQGSVAEGCFQKFAVSAFGQARIEQQREGDGRLIDAELPPLRRPLPSFGLEDAIIWAAQCRDELDLSEYEQRVTGLAYANSIPWFGLNALNPVSAGRVYSAGLELADRFPARSQANRNVRALARRPLAIAAMRAATVVAALIIGLTGAELTYDLWRFRQVRTDLERPDAAAGDFAGHRSFLDAFLKAPDYRHFASRAFISRGEAQSMQTRITDRHEHTLWSPVESLAPDVVAQEAPARAYLEVFPNGKHAPEATVIVQRSAVVRRRKENDDYLLAIATELDRLRKDAEAKPTTVKPLFEKLRQLPNPADETSEQKSNRDRLSADLISVEDTMSARDEDRRVKALIDTGNLGAAGQLVAELKGRKRAWSPYPALALAKAQSIIAANRTGSQWESSLNTCDLMKRAWQATGLLEKSQMDQLRDAEISIYEALDQELYGVISKDKTLLACQRYLKSRVPAELRKMRVPVHAFESYLQKRAGVLDLKFQLRSIAIGAIQSEYESAHLTYRVAGHFKGEIPDYRWSRSTTYAIDAKEESKLLYGSTSCPLTSSLDDQIRVTVKLLGKNGDGTEKDLGGADVYLRVGELLPSNAKRIDLSLTKHYIAGGPSSSVQFEIRGEPAEPPLPPYGQE